MFYRQAQGTSRAGCSGERYSSNPSYCSGPFFESDIPKDPVEEDRIAIRIMGHEVGMDAYLKAAKENGWKHKRWRRDPGVVVGMLGRVLADPRHLGLICTHSSSNNYLPDLTTATDWQRVMGVFKLQKLYDLSKPPTLMERIAVMGWKTQAFAHANRQACGGYSCLRAVQYDPKRDEICARYLLRNRSDYIKMRNPYEVFGCAPGFYHHMPVSRNKELLEVLNLRKVGSKKEKRFVKLMVDRLSALDQWNRSGGEFRPLPDIEDVRKAAAKQLQLNGQ
jgi:hypothetical protein